MIGDADPRRTTAGGQEGREADEAHTDGDFDTLDWPSSMLRNGPPAMKTLPTLLARRGQREAACAGGKPPRRPGDRSGRGAGDWPARICLHGRRLERSKRTADGRDRAPADRADRRAGEQCWDRRTGCAVLGAAGRRMGTCAWHRPLGRLLRLPRSSPGSARRSALSLPAPASTSLAVGQRISRTPHVRSN